MKDLISEDDLGEIIIKGIKHELRKRVRSISVVVDRGRNKRDLERIACYLLLDENEVLNEPWENIDQSEVCRGIITSVASSIQERFAHWQDYEGISIAGIGIREGVLIDCKPPEYEAFFGDTHGKVPWRLTFFIRFARWPEINSRSLEEQPENSALEIYAKQLDLEQQKKARENALKQLDQDEDAQN